MGNISTVSEGRCVDVDYIKCHFLPFEAYPTIPPGVWYIFCIRRNKEVLLCVHKLHVTFARNPPGQVVASILMKHSLVFLNQIVVSANHGYKEDYAHAI
jgi:hypothetical protein